MPVTMAGNDVIGAVESSTKVEAATVTAALAALSAPVHDAVRACTV